MNLHPALLMLPVLVACSDVKEDEDDHHHDHNHGVSTALTLHFTDGAGTTTSFAWEDPEGDGVDILIDDIALTSGTAYELNVEVTNQLEDPPEDVTTEIIAHGEEHQFFFTGSAVVGPASDSAGAFLEHAYNDSDADGLPLGVDNLMTATATGSGELTVTLRHMPPESGNAVKTASSAEDVKNGGFSAIGGDNDIQVTFVVAAN